jgi:hypothetical protein
MTGSVCGSAAGAAHRENWQNNLTHARIKSRKTKNTSQRTSSKNPASVPAGFYIIITQKTADQIGLYLL